MFRAVCIIIIVFSLLAILFFLGQPRPSVKTVSEAESVTVELDIQRDVVDKLRAAGWPSSAAIAVANVNAERFRWLHEVSKESLNRELRAFTALHVGGRVAVLVERHPQTAGLLLLARDPVMVADGILACPDEGDQMRLIGSFVKYTEPADVTRWAESIAVHGRCIAGLLQRCQAWPVDAVCVYPQTDAAVAKTYDLWLNKIFEPGSLPASDEEILSLMEFVMGNGAEIRRRLKQDSTFREMFLSSIWPVFERCVRQAAEIKKCRCPWELFDGKGHVWDLLKRPDGEALFQRAGLLAADLLYGSDAVDPSLREKTAQLLLLGNQALVERSFTASFAHHPQFRRLMLDRHLSDEQLLAVCNKLNAEHKYSEILGRWDRLSDQALAEDIGPPPDGIRTWVPGYGIYYAGKKLLQGRSVGWADAVAVGGDVWTIATLGGGKLLNESSKAAMRVKLRQEAVEDLAKLATRELAEQAEEKQLSSFIAHRALKTLPEELSKGMLKLGVIDVTSVVQSGFKMMAHFGVGRESLKRLTGLEARILLRKDAKVFVCLPSALAGNNPFARFLNETTINGAVDEVVQTQTAKEAIQTGLWIAKDAKDKWQEHLACWWSGLAISAFAKPEE